MKGRANCRVSILRGTETNDFGDEVDSEVAVHTGIPASIQESVRRVYLPAEQRLATVRSVTCRVASNVDLLADDRVRNEGNGRTYVVVELHQTDSAVHSPDLVVELSYTTA